MVDASKLLNSLLKLELKSIKSLTFDESHESNKTTFVSDMNC